MKTAKDYKKVMERTKIGQYYYDTETKSWEVRLDKEGWMSCKRQEDGEILSRLVRIEKLLKEKSK